MPKRQLTQLIFIGAISLRFCCSLIVTRGKGGAYPYPAVLSSPKQVNVHNTAITKHAILSVDLPPTDVSLDIRIVPSRRDSASFYRAATFMVDAYWLNSPLSMIADGQDSTQNNPLIVTDEVRLNLANDQAKDLIERYGKIKNERLLHSYLLSAVGDTNDEEILGLVGMEVRLCDRYSNVIHSKQKSEEMLRKALSKFRPDERNNLENICAPKLANKLLPPEISAVCVLSNLCVSPKARNRGLASKLCLEAEQVAGTLCGCKQIYLEVEEANIAARNLYEGKLGYELRCTGEAPAKRVDLASGRFVNIMAPTLVLSKEIE